MLSTDIAWYEVSITLLGPLQDLYRVTTFDWGSTALVYLYYRLNTIYRGTVRLLACSACMFLYPFFDAMKL